MSLVYPSLAEFLFLDLDGTLTDSSKGITRGILSTLERFGLQEGDTAKTSSLYRPAALPLLHGTLRLQQKKAYKAVNVFQKYDANRGAFENHPYPGIPELLNSWAEKGRTLILATSKPETYARRILEHFGMAGNFQLIVGSDIAETRVEKKSVLAYALERLDRPVAENALHDWGQKT